MGPHLMRRPPKYVQGFIDRHGKPRFYFRCGGFKRLALPGLPSSPEFMAAYEAARAGQKLEIGASRTKPGTMRAIAVSYYNSSGFLSLKPNSKATYVSSSTSSAGSMATRAQRRYGASMSSS